MHEVVSVRWDSFQPSALADLILCPSCSCLKCSVFCFLRQGAWLAGNSPHRPVWPSLKFKIARRLTKKDGSQIQEEGESEHHSKALNRLDRSPKLTEPRGGSLGSGGNHEPVVLSGHYQGMTLDTGQERKPLAALLAVHAAAPQAQIV
jgi:hypothetical protein